MTDEITLDAPETRIERFLAAAAGVEGITLDDPVTRIEKYLYKIGQGGGSGGLPPVTASDNGKIAIVADGAWTKGVQEYWIPVTYSSGSFSIDDNDQQDVYLALNNPNLYWVRGIRKKNGADFEGYILTRGLNKDYIAPFIDDSGKRYNIRVYYDSVSEKHLVSIESDKFIVTLTPTAADLSGTMDKTPQEITAAYNAGQEIVFEMPLMGAVMHATQFMDTGSGNIMVGVSIIYNSSLIMLTTSNEDDSNQYYTTSYPLTHAT